MRSISVAKRIPRRRIVKYTAQYQASTAFAQAAMLALTLISLALVSLALTPIAQAAPDDPFTPELTVFATDYQAGASPDLKITMQKTPHHCLLPEPYAQECDPADLYSEQNLKKMATHLPPGLLADANAAPYCDPYQAWIPSKSENKEFFRWFCKDPESFVGLVNILVAMCMKTTEYFPGINCIVNEDDPENRYSYPEIPPYPWPRGTFVAVKGYVYNDRPGPGEQGHLVVIIPDFASEDGKPLESPSYPRGFVKSDISIFVRDDMSIDAVADDIPDPIDEITRGGSCPDGEVCHTVVYSQIHYLRMVLYGSTGSASGHRLLRNPTFCDPQTVEVDFQGYAENADFYLATKELIHPAYGEGKTIRDTAPYQATDCDRLAYDPKLSLSLDDTGPAAVPAISSTVTQDPDEATTGNVEVRFPSSFKINAENTREHCSEADLQATEDDPEKDHCPESSRIGTVTAESPLIPIGEKLQGNVYLAGLTGDSVKFAAFLRGFVDLRIDAAGKVEEDLSITTTFKDLPAAPISRFDLLLDGGKDKGLLKTPKVCGPQTITADFKSHSGKVKRNTVPVEIEGCADPTLDVSLSTRRAGAPTDLDLDLRSAGTRLRSVELRMPRQLHWGRRRHLKVPRKKRLKSVGQVAFTTSSGEVRNRLKVRRTKRGRNLKFLPLARRSKEGKVLAANIPGFTANLFRTRRRQPNLTKRGLDKKTGQRRRRQADLTMSGFPADDLTAVELSLRGSSKRRRFYLKNPRCRTRLNFVAIVVTADGRRLALKDKAKIRGKGCPRKRRK